MERTVKQRDPLSPKLFCVQPVNLCPVRGFQYSDGLTGKSSLRLRQPFSLTQHHNLN